MSTNKQAAILLIALGAFFFGGGLIKDQIAHANWNKAVEEAAHYGVSTEELWSECTDFDGTTIPDTPEEVAGICWQIRHPKRARDSGWQGHIQEVAHWAVTFRDTNPRKIEAESVEEMPIETE
jgi:hypothetical protein